MGRWRQVAVVFPLQLDPTRDDMGTLEGQSLAQHQFKTMFSSYGILRGVCQFARTQSQWIELMCAADCCCEPVLSMTEAFAHAQTVAREMVSYVTTSTGEQIAQLGPAYKSSDTPPQMRSTAPALGQHTDELLEALGISAPERERLREAGIIRTHE